MTARLAQRWAGKLVVDHGGRRSTLLLPATAVTVTHAEPGEAVAPAVTTRVWDDGVDRLWDDSADRTWNS